MAKKELKTKYLTIIFVLLKNWQKFGNAPKQAYPGNPQNPIFILPLS